MITYKDIRPEGAPRNWTPSFKMQELLVCRMLDNLNIVQNIFGQEIEVVKGVVKDNGNINDYMLADHLYGEPIKSIDNIQRDASGDIFYFTVGAADIRVMNLDQFSVFKKIVSLTNSGKLKLGQVIYHDGYEDKDPWIHIVNDAYRSYSIQIGSLLFRGNRFFYTNDGGKTIKEFETDGRKKESRNIL